MSVIVSGMWWSYFKGLPSFRGVEDDIDNRERIAPRDQHDSDIQSPVFGLSHNVEPAVSLALLCVCFCCLRDSLLFRMMTVH